MRTLFTLCLLIGLSLNAFAQKYQTLSVSDSLAIKYKWKTNDEGNEELYVKFKNLAKTDVIAMVELGLYDAGIMEERVMLTNCLKKGFWHNWFRPVHVVNSASLANETILSESFEIEVLKVKIANVDRCDESE